MPLSEISVDSVWPLYGPVAGGTRVTITGQYLSTVAAVYFGQHQVIIDKYRSAFGLCILSYFLTVLSIVSREPDMFIVENKIDSNLSNTNTEKCFCREHDTETTHLSYIALRLLDKNDAWL